MHEKLLIVDITVRSTYRAAAEESPPGIAERKYGAEDEISATPSIARPSHHSPVPPFQLRSAGWHSIKDETVLTVRSARAEPARAARTKDRASIVKIVLGFCGIPCGLRICLSSVVSERAYAWNYVVDVELTIKEEQVKGCVIASL